MPMRENGASVLYRTLTTLGGPRMQDFVSMDFVIGLPKTGAKITLFG